MLKEEIEKIIMSHPAGRDLIFRANELDGVPVFGYVNDLLFSLIEFGMADLQMIRGMRLSFLRRNPHIRLFTIDNKVFGTSFAEPHVRRLVPRLIKPSKLSNAGFDNEYDLHYPDPFIRIEVKASRATYSRAEGHVHEKGARFGEEPAESDGEWAHKFCHLKPSCADVFVFVGVWLDAIRYWVLSSAEVAEHPRFNRHGRFVEQDSVGQIHIAAKQLGLLDAYLVAPDQIESAILSAASRAPVRPACTFPTNNTAYELDLFGSPALSKK